MTKTPNPCPFCGSSPTWDHSHENMVELVCMHSAYCDVRLVSDVHNNRSQVMSELTEIWNNGPASSNDHNAVKDMSGPYYYLGDNCVVKRKTPISEDGGFNFTCLHGSWNGTYNAQKRTVMTAIDYHENVDITWSGDSTVGVTLTDAFNSINEQYGPFYVENVDDDEFDDEIPF